MKILLLTQYYPPESGSASLLMKDISKFLSNKGHKVTVLTAFPNYPYGKLYPGYKQSPLSKERKDSINIIRTWSYISPKRKNSLHRLLNYVSFMLSAFIGYVLSSSEKPDIIYMYSPPIFLGITASILSFLYKVPYVIYLNDLWPDSAIAMGLLKNKLFIKLGLLVERISYGNAKKIFVYCPEMGNKLIYEKNLPEEKIGIQPLFFDTKSLTPREPDLEIVEKYNLRDKYVIVYAGAMGVPQNLDIVIKVAYEFKKRDFPIEFLMLGEGTEKNRLINKAKSMKLTNIKFLGQIPSDQINKYYSVAHMVIVSLGKAPHRFGTIPGKIFAYMSAGKPILAFVDENGATANLIRKYNCGIVIDPNSDLNCATTEIINVLKNKNLLSEICKNAREAVVSLFDKNLILDQLEKKLLGIIQQNL
ncbi:glycosyltransferase family 4 protein [Patescibacteria group bacterium]|nr:glycosyltransferase family 4 protein [Patescibacteria group bacterium]